MESNNGLYIAFLILIIALSASKKEANSIIGRNIIIQKDTLTVVDYSIITNKYVLSNGVTVDKTFLLNQLDSLNSAKEIVPE